MFSTILKHAVINIKKDRRYVLINFLCLIMGLSIAMFLYFWVRTEKSYDKFHKNSNNIYRIITLKKSGDNAIKTTYTAGALAQKLLSDYAYFSNAVSIGNETEQVCTYNDKSFFTDILLVDTTFFSVFSFPVLEGNVSDFVSNPNSAVISKEFANKMFGNESAIGKVFIKDGLYGKSLKTVVMVVDVPRNSHLQFEALIPMLSDPYRNKLDKTTWLENLHHLHYVKVKSNIDNIETKLASLQNVISNYRQSEDLLEFQPLKNIHLKTNFPDSFSTNNSDIAYVRLITIAIIIILLVIFFNYTTLDLSRAIRRIQVTSLKRLLGGSRQAIFAENFIGSLIITFVAVAISLLLTYLAMPFFNKFLGAYTSFDIDLLTIIFIIGLCVALPFLSGLVQLHFAIKGNLSENIKGKTEVLKNFKIGKVLSILQFAIALFFIIFAHVVSKQIHFMQNAQKNKETENIISLPHLIYSSYNVDVIRQELLKNPIIEAVSLFSGKLNDNKGLLADVGWNGKPTDLFIVFSYISTDYQLKDLLNLQMVEGRFLNEGLNVNDYFDSKYSAQHEFVINETAKKAMGLETATGQTLKPTKDCPTCDGTIVGVVKDFHIKSLKEKIEPLIIAYNPEALPSIIIKMRQKDKKALQFIEQIIEKHKWGESSAFTYNSLLEDNSIVYAKEKTIEKISSLFAFVICGLSIMGFMGIVIYYMNQQLNNMAIRKIHGANVYLLIKYYCTKQIKTYLFPAIFILIAGYYIVYKWLENFAYHIQAPYKIFIIVSILFFILLISIVSVIVISTERKSSIENLRK